MERISSRQNPAVKRFRALAHTADPEYMLLDGAHLLDEALACGVEVEIVALSDRYEASDADALGARARRAGARTLVVGDEVLRAISPVKQPSGIVAIARRPPAALDAVFTRSPAMVLVLDGVQDPGNVGAVVRVAEACGATGVIAGGATADPFGWKALRGSMGSAFRLALARVPTVGAAVVEARRRGLRAVAAVPRGGTPLSQIDLRRPVAPILGGEGAGLPPEILDQVDERLTIPMRPPVESLNVATAAALIAYEASRQRAGVAS